MLALLAFWGALFLPGFALLRLYGKDELEGGWLPTVAAGYVASFGLLTPLLVSAYALQLSVRVVSVGVAAVVLASAVALAWRVPSRFAKQRRGLDLAIRPEALLGGALLAVHLVMEARIGTWLNGDATFHVGRVRFLLEHGFNNRDIYLPSPHFARIYHTNILHGLLAVGVWLTDVDLLHVWHGSLAWAKLVIAAGHGYLAWAVFGKRWVAWIAALLAATTQAGMTYALYPNSIAVGWLVPTLVGVALRTAGSSSAPAVSAVKLALGGVVLSLVHSLYGAFLVLCLTPFLAGRAVFLRATGRSARRMLLCLAALASVLPSLLVAAIPRTAPPDAAPVVTETPDAGQTLGRLRNAREAFVEAHTPKSLVEMRKRWKRELAEAGGGHLEKELAKLEEDRWVLEPEMLGGLPFLIAGLASLVACGVRLRERRPALAGLATAVATLMAVLFVPALCSVAVALAGAPFIVARLVPILSTFLFTAVAGAPLVLVGTGRHPVLQPVLVLVAALAGTRITGHAPQLFDEHVRQTLKPAPERRRRLVQFETRRRLLRTHIPQGATVLTTLPLARHVVMLHDCYVIAADRGHVDIPSITQRRIDVLKLTLPDISWRARVELLRRYDVQHVVYRHKDRHAFRWALAHGQVLGRRAGWTVVRLIF